MTDRAGDGKGPSGDRYPSLVERVAKKIVVDKPQLAAPRDGAAPSNVPASLQGRAPEVSRERSSHDQPERLIENAFREEIPRDLLRGDVVGEVHRHARRSKAVAIDIASLSARNLLTPGGKRNRMVEEFRLIKRQVLGNRRSAAEALGNTVIVTSALPEEGKTTVAVNLAISIAAEEDLRVLLIDADFIKPNALRQLGVHADKGLIDVIQDPRLDIADVMLTTNIDKLSLIPAGQLHDRCTELLASARMRDIITELAGRYDDRILIFDSPPVLATTESVTLASHMSQIVFVVQAERTRRQLVSSALDLLGNRTSVGMVLNRATPRLGNAEFGSYYGAYYRYTEDKQDRTGTGTS